MTKTSKAQPGLFDAPVAKPKWRRSRYDAPVPIGRWMIQVPNKYVADLKLNWMDSYILEEHRASPGSLLGLRWYKYTDTSVRLLKCRTFDQYMDEMEGKH